MKRWLWVAMLVLTARMAWADDEGSQLTIYNQGFASVKERRLLDLRSGDNDVRISGLTSQLEPDSVMLRGLHGDGLHIVEQNYEADPLSEAAMLRASEGKTIDFEITAPQTGERRIVKGLIVRSQSSTPASGFQYGYQPSEAGEPIVEIDGKLQFGLPGKPLFDALQQGAFLQPTLLWKLHTDWGGQQGVELSYLTGGFSWEATYDAVTSGSDNRYDIVGWITLKNDSGKDFPNAHVKLVAGDVARVAPQEMRRPYGAGGMMALASAAPRVTEKAFDEYHLYTLPRPTTLRDRETKQVEFLHANHVEGKRLYVVESETAPSPQQRYGRSTGEAANKLPVNSVFEVKNTKEAGLGMPLPGGTVKVYRADDDGHNELIGEARIDHTPKDEKLRIVLGSAFDLVAERRMTASEIHPGAADLTFEIRLRNHKQEDATISVVEHLYGAMDWSITEKSMPFEKMDASTIRFDAPVSAGGETAVTYTVHYVW